MALMRFDPFRELDRLADQALARTMRTMPMEAFRRGDQFIVALDLPGVPPSDVDVTVERNVVEISARRRPLRQEGDELIVDERPTGEFRRQLFLGDNLDPNKLSAAFDLGVLTLTIPVSEASKPRKVEIGSANREQQVIEAGSAQQQEAESTQQQEARSGRQQEAGPSQERPVNA
jgi:HSP20 family protein